MNWMNTHIFKNIKWETLASNVGTRVLQLIILLIAYWIVKSIGRKIIDKGFANYKEKKELVSGRVFTLEKLILNVFSYVLFFVLIVTAFHILGIPVTSILAGASVVGLAVGFGAQGLVSDVVTGFFILLEQQIDVGDYVTVSGLDGIVEEVGLRTTHLRSFDGTLNFIPNRQISTLSNHSRGNMRALVDIGIAYDENIDEAISIIQKACDQLALDNEAIIDGPNVLGVQDIGNSNIVIRVIAHTQNGEQWGIERALKKAIKEAFDQHGIELPYPHQVQVYKNGSERGTV